MEKLRYFLYEIVSVSMGLALLGFFGTLSFLPMELHMMGEGQTMYYLFIFLCFGIVISFLVLSFIKRKNRYIIARVVDIASIICLIFVIVAFLTFTQDLFEPWLIQVGWFLRYNGFIVGLFMGLITIKTTISLSMIISNFNTSIVGTSSGDQRGHDGNLRVLSSLIIVLCFGFYIFAMVFYRYVSFFMLLTSIFAIMMGLLLFSVLLLLNANYYNYVRSKFFDNPAPNPGNNPLEAELKVGKSQKISNQANDGIIKKINSKLLRVGTHPKEFWLMFIPLLVVLVLGIVALAIYPLNLTVHLLIPYGGPEPMPYDMPATQLFSIIMVVLVFSFALFAAYGGRMYRRLKKFYKKKKTTYLKISNLGMIDALRFLGLFLVFSQILYFFEFPLYLPEIVSSFLLFGMIGAGVYFLVDKHPNCKRIVYTTAILVLLLNFFIIFNDGFANMLTWAETYSAEVDVLFPFTYLHSMPNFYFVGIPLGFIVSDLFFDLSFKHTDGTDSMNRTAAITITPFLLGLLFIPGNFILNNPGADVPSGDPTAFMFYLFTIALSIVLLVGLAFNYLVTEVLIPIFIEKKGIRKKNVFKKNKMNNPGNPPNARKKVVKGAPLKKKVIGLSLTGLVAVAFVGSFGILYTFNQTYQRPMLVHNPGNYLIWVQNSTERVTKDVMICTRTSPLIDAVEISLAKNEYAAFQLVWRPLGGPIDSLTCQIDDFEHQVSPYNISAGNCSMRYVDFIFEEEFPDILRPLTSLDLEKQENYVFWFDVRTPYDAIEGDYEGRLNFSFNGGQEEIITIRLHVWNFTIPNMRHLRTNIGSRSNSFTIIDNYIAHRMNDYGSVISAASTFSELNTQPDKTCWLNTSDDTWEFNWTWYDSLVQYKLDRGMNGFSVVTFSLGRDPPIEDATWMLRLKNWLKGVANHLETKGWLNYSYYYFIDEFQLFIPAGYTREEYFDRLEILLREMKNATTKLKIMTTTPPSAELEDLYDYIDIYCPISDDRDKARWDERLAADCEFWFYTCVGPLAPWPNSMLYDRLYAIRVLMWQAWLYNVHGYLFWYSYDYHHAKYGLAANGWGDGLFFYLQGGQIYDSIRWEQYLEGQEDYEYLWLLNATLKYLEENPGLIPVNELNNYKAEFNAIISSVVGEKWVYCDHVSTLYSGRDRIGLILDDLASVVNLTALGEAQWFPPYKPGA